MARKQDNKAARERKQKIIVAVAGVLFLGLVALQGPKLLKQLRGSESAAPAASSSASSSTTGAAPSSSATTTAATAAPVPVTPAVRAPKSATTQLAGVVIVPEQPVKAGDGQLSSFSRFDSKDPFVQQVGEQPLPTPAEVAAKGATPPNPAPSSAGQSDRGVVTPVGPLPGSSPASAGSVGRKPAAKPTLAVLLVNGKLQSLEAGKRFPKGDGAFVLRTLKPGRVGIAVANGSFAGGGVLTLRVGRKVTLVNTATGIRYVVKLVYLGDESNLTRFSSK
jgi:hypothetical protein